MQSSMYDLKCDVHQPLESGLSIDKAERHDSHIIPPPGCVEGSLLHVFLSDSHTPIRGEMLITVKHR